METGIKLISQDNRYLPVLNNISICENEKNLDKFDISEFKDKSPIYSKVFGTVGAGCAALAGRLTVLPTLGATALGLLGGSFAGPIGKTAGGIAGACIGLAVEMGKEFKGIFPLGRVIGGTFGGIIGSALGFITGKLGLKIPLSKEIVKETNGFSLPKLLKNLPNPCYTSHKKLPKSSYDEIIKIIKPGDVLLTTQDLTLSSEVPEYLLGGKNEGNWIHGAIYAGDDNLVESNGYFGEIVARPLKDSIAISEHAIILRPHYKDKKQTEDVIKNSIEHMGKPYTFDLNLDRNNGYYCTEFVYYMLKDKAPQLNIETSKVLKINAVTGDDFLKSKDFDIIYNTGSNFIYNYLSKFD